MELIQCFISVSDSHVSTSEMKMKQNFVISQS